MSAEIFEIPSWRINCFEKEVSKLNRKALRIGAPPIEAREIEIKQVADPRYENATHIPVDKRPKIRVHVYSIICDEIKIDGYTFVGTLDHHTIPGSVIIKAVPGEIVPPEYYDHDASCDHCNRIRRRNQTFVLRDERGNHKAVGRQCVRDFIGRDPKATFSLLTSLWKTIGSFRDEDWFGGSYKREYCFDHEAVLKMTAGMIRTYGWVPRSSANPEEGRIATADNVSYALLPPFGDSKAIEAHRKFVAEIKFDDDQDDRDVKESRAWLRSLEPTNEYVHNLQAIDDAETVGISLFGFWCSLMSSFYREQERLNINKAQNKISDWYGTPGDRIELDLSVLSIKRSEGYYGVVNIVNMLDNDGRSFMWFTSSNVDDMEPGNKYPIRATIKKHDKFNNWKQTHVSRLKVIEETCSLN